MLASLFWRWRLALIGGLCSKCLRFTTPSGEIASLEDVLLRHAVGTSVVAYQREALAAGVMMIPIPGDGLYKGVAGLDDARAVDEVDEVNHHGQA